jgi:ABC-type bacteriocin/lantibiotic exporter with double-glycine peptidase domain
MIPENIRAIFYSHSSKVFFIIVFCCLREICFSFLSPGVLSYLSSAISQYTPSASSNNILMFILALVAVDIIGNIFYVFIKYLQQKTYPIIEQQIRSKVFSHSMCLPVAHINREGEGKIEAQNDAFATGVMEVFSCVCEKIIPCVVLLFAFITYITMQNTLIGLAHIALIGVYGTIFFILSKYGLKLSRAYNKSQNERASKLVDLFKNIKLVKIFRIHRGILVLVKKIFSVECSNYRNYLHRDYLNSTMLCFLYISLVATIYFLLYRALTRGILEPFRVLAIFQFNISITVVVDDFVGAVAAISEEIGQIQQSSSQLFEQNQSRPRGKLSLRGSIDSIDIRNLTYARDGKIFIRNLTLNLSKGDVLVIMGHSGAGKSTLINLILGLVETTDGTIFINGIDINKYSEKSIFSKVMYIGQSREFFNISILRNFKLIDPKLSVARIRRGFKKMRMSSLLSRLYDSMGSNGSHVSGGQGTRLSILRAKYSCKPSEFSNQLVCADEPTTGLDRQNQSAVCEYLLGFKASIYIITDHSQEMAPRASKVLFLMKDGVHKIGTHKELLKFQLYREFFS